MNVYVVLDKRNTGIGNSYVGEYQDSKVSYSLFSDRINQVHQLVEEGKHPAGYYIDSEYVTQYDFNYVPPAPSYKVLKAKEFHSIRDAFDDLSVQFAADNSEILNAEITRKVGVWMADNSDPDGLNPGDNTALAIFVQSKLSPLVDALKPLFEDIKMHYFWRVEQHIAAVPREPLLASEERLLDYQSKVIAVVRP